MDVDCSNVEPKAHLKDIFFFLHFLLDRCGSGVAVVGDFMYVIGGNGINGPLRHCERYSFSENKWTEIKPLSVARGFYLSNEFIF